VVSGVGDGCHAVAGGLPPPQHVVRVRAPPPHILQGMTSSISNLPPLPPAMSNLLLVPSPFISRVCGE
jgi:hypothetical protein